ncbi:MAG: ribonuclease P protein subunit [Candidatus Thermoplasmatota archaeon]|nr:ribonuclease P protein subunit [Candidatus Thermoplasmatota archaeon]
MNIYNNNWLGKTLNVIHSNDVTLVSKQGLVIDETKKTITIQEDGKLVKLGKSSIKFTINDSNVVIDGALVGQRPENRTHRKYRMA